MSITRIPTLNSPYHQHGGNKPPRLKDCFKIKRNWNEKIFYRYAILLSFVWTVSAQTQVYRKTDTTLQQKGDYNDVYFEQTHNDWPMGCMATAMTTVMKYHESPKDYNYTIIKGENGLAQLMYDAALSVSPGESCSPCLCLQRWCAEYPARRDTEESRADDLR